MWDVILSYNVITLQTQDVTGAVWWLSLEAKVISSRASKVSSVELPSQRDTVGRIVCLNSSGTSYIIEFSD